MYEDFSCIATDVFSDATNIWKMRKTCFTYSSNNVFHRHESIILKKPQYFLLLMPY